MKSQHRRGSNDFVFRMDGSKTTHFLFLLSDFSAFGNPAKKPMKIRGNFRKCMKILLGNALNEFGLVLKSGENFEVGPPIFTRGRTKEDIEDYHGAYGDGEIKPEPPHLEVQITIPPGEAIKIYSIEEGYFTYLVNQGGAFYETNDFVAVEEATGTYF